MDVPEVAEEPRLSDPPRPPLRCRRAGRRRGSDSFVSSGGAVSCLCVGMAVMLLVFTGGAAEIIDEGRKWRGDYC